MVKLRTIIRIVTIIITAILLGVGACVLLNRNTYVFHLVEFWYKDASIYIDLSREESNPWKCNSENMEFVAEDYIRPEPYVEMEVANGTLTTEEGEEVEFYIEFEAESYFLTVYIEDHEYLCMGLYSYGDDKSTYTLIFNHKNWPKEYLGKDIRPITFVEN